MDLGHQRAAAVGEAGRQVHLPQRAGTVERLGQRPVAQRRQAPGVGAVVRVAQQGHVAVDVEALVVDPERLPHPRQREAQPAPKAGCQLKPPLHASAQVFDPQRGAAFPRLEEGAPGHMHVRVLGLHAEEGAVEGGEAIGHVSMLAPATTGVIGPAVPDAGPGSLQAVEPGNREDQEIKTGAPASTARRVGGGQ